MQELMGFIVCTWDLVASWKEDLHLQTEGVIIY